MKSNFAVFVGVADDNRDKIKDQRGQLKSKWYFGGGKEESVRTGEVLIWSPPGAGNCKRARNVTAFPSYRILNRIGPCVVRVVLKIAAQKAIQTQDSFGF